MFYPGMPMAYDMGAKRMREAGEYGMGRLGKPTGVSEVMEVHHAVFVLCCR